MIVVIPNESMEGVMSFENMITVGGVLPTLWVATLDNLDNRDIPLYRREGMIWKEERYTIMTGTPLRALGDRPMLTTLRMGYKSNPPKNKVGKYLYLQHFTPLGRLLSLNGNPISSISIELDYDSSPLVSTITLRATFPSIPAHSPCWGILPNKLCETIID